MSKVVMKKDIFRLLFGCSLSMIVGLAAAQDHSSRGGSGSSGGNVSRSSGGGNRSQGTPTRSSGTSGGYRSNGPTGERPTTGAHYGGSSGYSRYQSRPTQEGPTSTRSEGTSTSRYSRGYAGPSRSSTYQNRTNPGSISPSRPSEPIESNLYRGHANLSRSGGNSYSGNNNRNGVAGITGAQQKFGAAPSGRLDPSRLGHVIGGGGPGLVRGGYRTGYFGYHGGWRDSFFAFPFYVFDPFFASCYVSPWYYYPCLPGYVAAPNVVIVDSYPSTNWTGDDYDWSPGSRTTTNAQLDDSVQDLVAAFEADDHKAIDRVAPHSGNVNIYVDGKYSYSLKANDFYDTYVDGIESTKTDRYEVLDVKANANGTARVVAKHVYNDPWGNRTYVYHSYFLVKEGDDYVIREFGTSDYRTGW